MRPEQEHSTSKHSRRAAALRVKKRKRSPSSSSSSSVISSGDDEKDVPSSRVKTEEEEIRVRKEAVEEESLKRHRELRKTGGGSASKINEKKSETWDLGNDRLFLANSYPQHLPTTASDKSNLAAPGNMLVFSGSARFGDTLSNVVESNRTNGDQALSLNDESKVINSLYGNDGKGETDDSEFMDQLARRLENATAREQERKWYDSEETGDVANPEISLLLDDSYVEIIKRKEAKYRRDHHRLALVKKKRVKQEQDLWELNRLVRVGIQDVQITQASEFLLENNEDDDTRVMVMVNDAKPPFIQKYSNEDLMERGRGGANHRQHHHLMESSSIAAAASDQTSDLMRCARQGSRVLMQLKENKDRTKLKERFWDLAGSTMGRVLGLRDDQKEADAKASAEEMQKDLAGRQGLGVSLLSATATADSETIAKQRALLPVSECKEALMRVIREHNVVIVVGETGSGKTTQLTQFLYEAGYGTHVCAAAGGGVSSNYRFGFGADDEDDDDSLMLRSTPAPARMIGCTQPRRVAAVSVAKRVADELGVTLGQEVGYSIRFEDYTTPGVTAIKYMTDAFLLREILSDADVEKYDVIIMDEAHERSLATDVLFGLLKEVLRRRSDFKLIVTSATLNAQSFASFFGNAPIFKIPGRTFPVKIVFERSCVQDYVDAAVQKALRIHCQYPFEENGEQSSSSSDILIFMTGQEDIEGTCILLCERAEALKEKMEPLTVLPIYSQLPSDVQARVFEKAPNRKVIVATNIAETSLTLEGVRYVIDSGFCKLKVFSPKIGMDILELKPISRANANQRAGRAGRTAPGVCYRLYTERAFLTEMTETQIPEIQRTNLAYVVLLLKSLKVDDLLSFGFMDPPDTETILNAMIQLWMLGAFDDEAKMTLLGNRMAQLPVDPSLARMILLSNTLNCSMELLGVVAMLSVSSVFHKPKGRTEQADAVLEKFAIPESDHLTLLHVFEQWKANKYSPSWASRHFLNQKSLSKVRDVRMQLIEILHNQKIEPISCGRDWTVVRKVISSGYFHHAAKARGVGEYVNLRTSISCHLHPSSALYLSGLTPEYVVYHEIMVTFKEYMHHVTAIEPQWLVELGPKVFSLRTAGTSSSSNEKKIY